MYDTEEPVLRRVLAIILWAVVIVAVVWAVIWFVFFRGHAQPSNTGGLTHKNTTSQNKPQGQQPVQSNPNTSTSPSTSSSSQTANNAGSSLGSNNNSSSSTTQTPTQLANTGAGNIFVPFTLAAVAGSAVYYIRLRRKLTQ